MLAIRLARIGRKKQPSYRIIVSEKRYKRNGRYIDKIGFYNPLTTEATVSVNRERFDYWVKMGAQPTPVIQRLVLGIKGTKKRAPKKAVKEEAPGPKAAPAAATEATQEVVATEEATGAVEETQIDAEEKTEAVEAPSEEPAETADEPAAEETNDEKAN